MTSFSQAVYEITRQIPAGKVVTYQDIALWLGKPKTARAVGMAIAHNPDPDSIPCHRVIGSDGKLHGYAFGDGIASKRALLEREGVIFVNDTVAVAASRWHGAPFGATIEP